jgi:hypothetical protein
MDGKDLAEMGEIEGVTRTLSAKSTKSTKGCASRSDTAFGIGDVTEEVIDDSSSGSSGSNDDAAVVVIKDSSLNKQTIKDITKPLDPSLNKQTIKDVKKPLIGGKPTDQCGKPSNKQTNNKINNNKEIKKEAGSKPEVQPEVWKPEMAKSGEAAKEAERDVVKEYVLQEEEKIAKRRAKNMPLKFRDLKPVSVAKNRAKLQQSSGIPVKMTATVPQAAATGNGNTSKKRKPFAPRSLSTANLTDFKKIKTPPKMGAMSHHSMERLPTLSAFDEDRIKWVKNLEDTNMLAEERRSRRYHPYIT